MNLEMPQARAPEPADLEEERLVRAVRSGAAEAFEQLYARHHRRVYGLAWRLTAGGRGEAEEIVQEVFVRAWEHRAKFESALHLRRWLRKVAVNLWINRLRGHESIELGDDERLAREAAPPAASPRVRIDLESAIAGLPPRLRAVLLLFDLYGLRHEEIADELGITAGASKVQLHRARKRLREVLS